MILFKHIFLPLVVVYTIIFLKFVKVENKIQKILHYSFGIYVLLVIGITIFPMPVDAREIQVNIKYDLGLHNNFIPIKNTYDNLIMDTKHGLLMPGLKQIIGNIIMFMPIGFYLPIVKKNIKLKKIIFTGFMFSLSIELCQFIINSIIGYNYRAVDIDDIILNVIGCIAGYLSLKVIYPFIKKLVEV